MKTSLFFIMMIIVNITVFGQDDDTVQYIHGLPETGEDTSHPIPMDTLRGNNYIPISHEQIPRKLHKSLTENSLYKGWQSEELFFDKKTGLYLLRMKDADRIRTYRFDPKGNPVSIVEKDITESK